MPLFDNENEANVWDAAEDAEECAILLGERFNMPHDALLHDPAALVEVCARWHIRGDGDVEAMTWLTELVSWQHVSSDQVARRAAVILERELMPPVEALALSSRIPTLPA